MTQPENDDIDEALVARVRALGPYDSDGADEATDRAYTERCWVTYADLDDGAWIEIHSDLWSARRGTATMDGVTRVLNRKTMGAIIQVLDAAGFPYHDD